MLIYLIKNKFQIKFKVMKMYLSKNKKLRFKIFQRFVKFLIQKMIV